MQKYKSKKEDEYYYIFSKQNIKRFEIIKGFAEHENIKIRLITDNSSKLRFYYFLSLDKFESIHHMKFQENILDNSLRKKDTKEISDLNYFEKFFQRKINKNFQSKKAIIYLDDFLNFYKSSKLNESKNDFNSYQNYRKDCYNKFFLKYCNEVNADLYFSFLFYKKYIKERYLLSKGDLLNTNKLFHDQLYSLLNALKYNDIDSIIFADSKKYENYYEAEVIKYMLKKNEINCKFIDMDYTYIFNEDKDIEKNKEFHFMNFFRYLIFKNKKYSNIRYHLKKFYKENINDYHKNRELLNIESNEKDNDKRNEKISDFNPYIFNNNIYSKYIKDLCGKNLYTETNSKMKFHFENYYDKFYKYNSLILLFGLVINLF